MKYLAYYRKLKGLTQEELAECVNTQTNTISRYELGKIEPSLKMAHAIAETLGVTESELLNGPPVNEWKLIVKYQDPTKEEFNLTGNGSSAILSVGANAMGVNLSGPFDLWEDDDKFEKFIELLRHKRKQGLRNHKEDLEAQN